MAARSLMGHPSDHLDSGHVASFVDPHVNDDGSLAVVVTLERPGRLDTRPDSGGHDRTPDSRGSPRLTLVLTAGNGDNLYGPERHQDAKNVPSCPALTPCNACTGQRAPPFSARRAPRDSVPLASVPETPVSWRDVIRPDALQGRRTSPTSLNLRSCLGTEHVHRAISPENEPFEEAAPFTITRLLQREARDATARRRCYLQVPSPLLLTVLPVNGSNLAT
jgi:hypothetical protein